MKAKTKYIISACCGILSVLLIFLVKTYDVLPVSSGGTSIGFSHVNKAVFDFLGVNFIWYNITNALGILALLVACVFALCGFIQMIKRKSLFKTDKAILALGGLYVVMGALYVLFEKVIINYRPIIMPDNEFPEASFPSSHTMLVCVIIGSAAILAGKYIKNRNASLILQILCGIIIITAVIGRMFSGVHWFTDIIGSILISSALLLLYSAVIQEPKQNLDSRK